jgi:hypothetical protein
LSKLMYEISSGAKGMTAPMPAIFFSFQIYPTAILL